MIIKYSRMDVITDHIESVEVDVEARSELEAIERVIDEICDNMIEYEFDHEVVAGEVREYFDGELYKIHYGFNVVE